MSPEVLVVLKLFYNPNVPLTILEVHQQAKNPNENLNPEYGKSIYKDRKSKFANSPKDRDSSVPRPLWTNPASQWKKSAEILLAQP
ncbi:hypothetical protein SESBI_49272 [Sesbania bispinosa]|nr:hypothetical protein SESBI_49272 [Sesbania bispinosa]